MPVTIADPDQIVLFAVAAGIAVTASSLFMGFLVYPALQDLANQMPAKPMVIPFNPLMPFYIEEPIPQNPQQQIPQ